MEHPADASVRPGRRPRRRLAGTALAVALIALAACGGDDEETSGGDEDEAAMAADQAAELLGPEDQASGEPVKVGFVSDGSTDAYDNTDELRAAQATAEFLNTHRGGIGGRPIEVVTCETGGDPAGATDCGNQLVEEEVLAATISQSVVAEPLWEPLHEAGVPVMFFQSDGQGIMTDDQSSFNIINPLTTLFGLPVAVAESEDADKVAFAVIDVPQATAAFDALGPTVLENAGLDYELIQVPAGTADMTSHMQEVVDSEADVVHLLGNDAFCISAFEGLAAAGYEGAVSTIAQCVTDATREGVDGELLEGVHMSATMAVGAEDDETYQRYQAVMDAFGEEVEDVDNALAMGAYTAVAALGASLEGLEGEVTTETIIETIKAMPETELPGGGGVTFRCGGSAISMLPAVCSNEWLRTELDAEGQPTTYEAVDSTEILEM
jgi:branched-chain amino acid transport system substrate-binding protein